MKNVELNFNKMIKKATTALMIILCIAVSFTVKADIIDLSATVEGGYVPGTKTTVLINVMFDSNTAESADFIEFRLNGAPSGTSLWHGLPSPSPYQGCGLDKGVEMTATGPGWGTPAMMDGDSGCGAFSTGTMHTFGIEIISPASLSDPIAIEVRAVGDGNGETTASESITQVMVLPVVCTIVCPTVAPVSAGNSCSMVLNIPAPTVTGDCGTAPTAINQEFPVGTTNVEYSAMDANGNEISCTTVVTVIDDEDPLVLGLSNLTYDLSSGECGVVIPQNFTISENCTDPEIAITQSNSLSGFDAGYNCIGGPTKYIRVFDAAGEGVNTELHIEQVTFGVLEAFGDPYVAVNVYKVNGTPSYANMELVGSGNDILPNFSNGLYTIPVTATIEADETFAIEIVVPGSQYNGVIMAMNQAGESAPSYVASDFCGLAEPTTMNNAGYPGYALIMAIEGYQSSYALNPAPGSPLLGDMAPIGVTPVDYVAVDAYGNEANIDFTVTVNGFGDAITAIACNDEVQVSLDDACEAIVTADQILEGGPYGCFDTYTVEIEDENGNNYGNTVTEANVGQKLTVRVISPEGNSCWGTLLVQDKNPVPLDCLDVTTTCFGDVFPGSPIAEMVTFPANVAAFNETISDGAPSSNVYTFSVKGLVKSTIDKVGVRLNIEHDRVSDLNATLAGPDGTTVTLFIAAGTDCDGKNLQIMLDDEAFNTYADLETACDTVSPAISGMYKPQQLMNIFNGKNPNGDWLLSISDANAGNGGTVIKAELVISQSGGVVTFPTDKDIVWQTEGNNVYTVMGMDACGPATLSYNDELIEQDCSSPYSALIQRTWSATDASGNVTPGGCVQNIYVFRNGLSTLMFPPNYDGVQEPALSCSTFADSIPSTEVTGAPSGDLCDNVQIFPHTDTKIEVCRGSYKLVRHFQLLEWCSGEVVEHNQIIKVIDNEGPVLAEVEDVTISAGELDCTGNYVVPKVEVLSDCSEEFEYEVFIRSAYDQGPPPQDTVYFTDNVSVSGGNHVIKNLPFGRTWIQVRVHDECGNYTDIYYTLTVEDQVNPIAVCDEFTTVSIGSDGLAEVYATTFDDGSLDNCGIQSMLARKMTNKCAGIGTQFAEKIYFCCEEVGETIMVAFQVTDNAGNKNTCMVEVTVQDKLPPYITQCPADITLDCQADYSDPKVTGEPEYVDNCSVEDVSFVDDSDINNCGEGLVRRTWTVIDKQGFKATCVQKIFLEDDDPFEENDIRWPRDYDASTCDTDLSPENLPVNSAYPRYDDDNCSLVATVYSDKVFTLVDGSCEKILREWVVIDWCTYDDTKPLPTEGEGYYTHIQVIKLKNIIAPEITNCNDITADVYGNCEGPVTYTLEATDDCTPSGELRFSYQIDLFGDGLNAEDFNLKGNGARLNRTLPVGKHTVKWTVEDKCGNPTFCDMELNVVDRKKPTPYCLSSITTVVMNNSGSVDIWAKEFDRGSYDNCTPQEELKFSFSSNVNDTSRTLTCDDMPNGEEEKIQIEMWVTDNAGNQDYCSVELILQDSQDDVCDGIETGTFSYISGSTLTESSKRVENVTVNAFSPTMEVYKTGTTNSQGKYTTSNLAKGPNYFVSAEKNDFVTNGVSTIDLVLIQRHILGLDEFTSPYKVIASDVNDDDKLNAADLLSLRKVILGVLTEFPNGQKSWRFIPKTVTFADVNDPYGYSEEINIGNLQSPQLNKDLVAVKIGDVNDNVVANLQDGLASSIRTMGELTLVLEDELIDEGVVEVPVYAEGMDDMVGVQFTMNTMDAEVIDVVAGQLEVDGSNFNTKENTTVFSWNDTEGQEINDEEPLFTFVLDLRNSAKVSDLLTISSKAVVAEAYDDALNTYSVALETRSDEITEGKFALFQNRPNPFMEETEIKFYLPEATNVEFFITDVTGRILTRRINYYAAGTNSINVKYKDLNTSGVLYYTIKAGAHTATKKMINVR